ncbi:MAG TPA: glycogen/starch synthase [Candidatus Angelobacter sp.]|nr:glycogen/starch synthase [Candidatus Angelobacter sp.]
MTRPLHVAFVWHMHQPYYKDDLENAFLLPWVRLRCAKDYVKMPALLDDYPTIKQTFNLVPALVDQIRDYASGRFTDVYLDLARRPVTDLTPEERAFTARWMTESSQLRRVRQSSRYLELVRKREQGWPRSAGERAKLFSDGELRDLQVWFNLSWIGPEMIERDPAIAELVAKGRDFTEADKDAVFRVQFDQIAKVLPKYREVQERGQAELITSPAYHPILPLIADLAVARVARPDIAMPRRPFVHPEDAADQLRLGVDVHQRAFGARPRGMWPPEAALSDQVVALAAEQGIEWVVSDEGVLARSLPTTLSRDGEGQVMQADVLYSPYRAPSNAGSLQLVFRDARLSNAIGFEYQNAGAEEAATDLVDRLHGVQRRQGDTPFLAVIALDGENCWDFYEANGNPFLHALYRRLSHDPDLQTVTVSEFLSEFPSSRSLARIHPGSWINASFDTWVGDHEHNLAWERLADARDFLGQREGGGDDAAKMASARREALIAEGSDWFWWFGRSHDSGMDQIWDSLFRLHLRNIYMSLGQDPPAGLYQPITKDAEGMASKRPDRKITPKLNGVVDDDEWRAGGYVDVSAIFGAMHPPKGAVRRIWFGHDDRNLYLRFDLTGDGGRRHPVELEMRFTGHAGPSRQLRARPQGGEFALELNRLDGDGQTDNPAWTSRASAGPALAFAVPFDALGYDPGETIEMVATAYEGGQPVEQLPPTGAIAVRVPGDVFQGREQGPLKILLVSAEVAPFAKVGGLADVAGALPKALRALGHDVRVVMPRYGSIDVEKYHLRRVLTDLRVPLAHQPVSADVLEGRIGDEVPIYFIENQQFFGREGMYGFWDDDARFIYFSRAALEMLRPLGFQPDVIHVNDWHTAVIPNMLSRLYAADPFFADIATVLTIHNLAFQGVFGYGTLHLAELEQWGLIRPGIAGLDDIVNLLGRGLYFSDVVNTVSNRYAEEILTPEYGEKMDPLLRVFKNKLYGIINGIDYDVFNPRTDASLAAPYDIGTIDQKVDNKLALQKEVGLPQDASVPVIGLISRLYDQKGLDLIANIMWGLMRLNLQLVVLGAGDNRYEEMFRNSARDNPLKVSATIGFKPVLAQHIYAGADMFLMPSRFEPCGLGQLISVRYGTIPIVRATGGLADTIQDWDPVSQSGNGFVFSAYDHWDLYAQVVRALETHRQPALWRRLQANAMSTDVSWANSAQRYVSLYRTAMARHAEAQEYVAAPTNPSGW